jgi:CPA1 family monovalent cation:H+ antiporter
VLAATTIPATLRDARPGDVVLLGALIVGATLARAVAIYLILPLTLGDEQRRSLQPDHKLVMLWGGLRGAVTLALVLGVKENLLVPHEVRHAVAVLATGYVLFTLLVQATTLRPLIRLLELDRLSPLESLLRARALQASRADIAERVRQVAAAVGVEPPRADPVPAPQAPSAEDLTRAQLLGALATISRREIELLVEEQARSLLPRRAAAGMIAEARALLDALRTSGLDGYRRAARRQSGFDRATRLAASWHRRTGRTGPLRRRLADRVVRLLVRRDVLEQIVAFIDRRIEVLFGERIAELAGRVVQARLEDTERGLDAVRLQYPDYWRALTARYLQAVALQLERQALHGMAVESLLSASLHRSLLTELARRERAADTVPGLDLGLDVRRLMEKLPLLGGLAPARLAELAAMLRPRLALPGERILAKGSPGDAMHFIASGAVEVVLGSARVRLGSGEFFGELALITSRPRVADVMALGYCQLLTLRREDFRRFLRAHPELVAVMRRVASERAGRAVSPSP